MRRASHFKVSSNWKLLLSDMKIDVEAVLAYAKLPADIFNRESATLTPLEYFQLWQGVEAAAGGRDIPLLFAEHLSVEAFDAPIFASICSPDLNTALRRIQQYKPLIGPMDMEIRMGAKGTALSLSCYGHKGNLPKSLELRELVFFTQLSRLATRHPVKPTRVILTELPAHTQAYQLYFGCPLQLGEKPEICAGRPCGSLPKSLQAFSGGNLFSSRLSGSEFLYQSLYLMARHCSRQLP